ncbi:MAG: GNAT family N-acetyltransferase [Flavobacteriales bacterium]|nr:GNAT family N-acetyltransferase [Flavobacteriales bacterium]MBK9194115.1 GNAT family N-acetyltransferase [Flavobacteriales bacterium]MBP6573153.1 GNAT family N-acetyltransferase [Flavobacteriales bacterium]
MIIPFEGGALRPLHNDDKPAFTSLINDRNIWLQLTDGVAHPYTLAHADAFFARVDVVPPYVLAITTPVHGPGRTHQLVGLVGAHPMSDVERDSAEIGYWIGASFHGQALATKALRAIIPYAFGTLNRRRLQARVYEGNEASMRVLEKCGFRREGLLRKAVVKNGRVLDLHMFGLLREE